MLSNRPKARILVEERLVVALGWIEYLEREVPEGDLPRFDTEQFTDELSEIMLDLYQKVSCLFDCDVHLFVFERFFSSNNDEELIGLVEISLQL